jgi:hypothetical protein
MIRSKYDKKENFGEDNGIDGIYNDITQTSHIEKSIK